MLHSRSLLLALVIVAAAPELVQRDTNVHLCEPGLIRSPDGKQMAVLLRENARRKNSHVVFSNDEGKTWSKPRAVPLALTGDRHTGKYGPDGRLFISYRCISPKAHRAKRPFEGDWVGWLGSWEDLEKGRAGRPPTRSRQCVALNGASITMPPS